MSPYCLPCRKTIGWEFHHKRRVFALYERLGEEPCQQHSHCNADGIEQHHDCRAVSGGKERACYHDVNGQPCRAAHHRKNQHCNQSAALALYGSGRHDCRNVAAEAHDERNERLAVQSHLVHEAVHDERCTRHVAAVFHVRDEEIEDKDLRKEHDDSPHARNGSVYEHGFHRPVGQGVV